MARKKPEPVAAKPVAITYHVIAVKGADAAELLAAEVARLQAEGWKVEGGVASDGNRFLQAMTK